MRRLLAASLLCALPCLADAQGLVPTLKTMDQNGAAFSGVVQMTAGAPYRAGRSIGILCTTAGNITLTNVDGSSITLPIYVGWNTYPFAVTSFSWPNTGAGAGSVYNLY